MRVVIQGLGEIEILAIAFALPPIARDGGLVAIANVTGNLFPIPPIVIVVCAFDLVRRGRRAPEKAVGKQKCAHFLKCSRCQVFSVQSSVFSFHIRVLDTEY